MNKKTKYRRVDAKQTALGRFVCRLLGDETGQALMEYVVLGVLVVAAVVAAVIFFGDGIQNRITVMYHSIFGHYDKAEKTTEDGISAKDDTNVPRSEQSLNTIQGQGEGEKEGE